MRLRLLLLALAFPTAAALAQGVEQPATVPAPEALLTDGVPPVPAELAAQTRPYMEFRSANFSCWHPSDRSMLVTTRFANTAASEAI